jgi:hypothetical protein
MGWGSQRFGSQLSRYGVGNFGQGGGSSPVVYNWTANGATLQPIESSMIAYWKMEDLTDSKGSHTLTGVNTPTFTAGKHNNALTLNGSSQYVTAVDSSDFDLGISGKKFSFVMWAKSSSSATSPMLNRCGTVNDWNATNGHQYIMQFQAVDTVAFYFNTGGAPDTGPRVACDLDDGNSHQIIVTYDGTTTKMYADGALGSGTSTSAYSKPTNTPNFGIGRNLLAPEYFSDQIDEVFMLQNYCLSTEQIAALYNGGTGAFYTG